MARQPGETRVRGKELIATHPGLQLSLADLTLGHGETEKTLGTESASSLRDLKMCIDMYFIICYKTSFGYTGHCAG